MNQLLWLSPLIPRCALHQDVFPTMAHRHCWSRGLSLQCCSQVLRCPALARPLAAPNIYHRYLTTTPLVCPQPEVNVFGIPASQMDMPEVDLTRNLHDGIGKHGEKLAMVMPDNFYQEDFPYHWPSVHQSNRFVSLHRYCFTRDFYMYRNPWFYWYLKKHLFSKTLLSIENADACLQHNRNTGER